MMALLTACLLFRDPCARAELHQQKHVRKLCSATLTVPLTRFDYCGESAHMGISNKFIAS